MTAQFPDSFIYNDRVYDLAGYSDEEPFNPSELGFKPVGTCSACWRGYVAEYGLDSDRNLILKNLSMSLFETAGETWKDRKGEPINGVSPSEPGKGHADLFNNCYENVDLVLPYSGGLLIAHGFIQDLYVHMGFHPAWKYREVHELIFEKGSLCAAIDRSAAMEQFRSQERRHLDSEEELKDIQAWIEKTFDRRYT